MGSLASFIWQLPELVALKDSESRYVAFSQKAAKLLFNSETDKLIIGKKDCEQPSRAACLADVYCQQDNVTLVNGPQKIIDVNFWSDNKLRGFVTTKKPIIYENNKFILLSCVEINDVSIINLMKRMNDKYFNQKIMKSVSLYHAQNDADLSNREKQCLFLLIHGMTAKMMAEYLCLSARTIENHIINIKAKLKCHTKTDLVELSIANDLYYRLLPSIMKIQSSPIDRLNNLIF